jgi:hypothetical protein
MTSALSLNVLEQAVDSGLCWLSRLQQESGEYRECGHDLAGYYKSPLLFAECGQITLGARCLSFIRRHFLAENGELRFGDRKTSLIRMERNLANYMDGWVALGAWIFGDYELAERLAKRLMSAQSGKNGGVETGPTQWAIRERYDLATAASCGRAFLRAGHRDAALAAGEFLCSALEHQEDISAGLNLSFDSSWNRLKAEDPSERSYFWFDLSERGEKVWFPAFSCGYLSELYELQGDSKFIDAARRYFAFIAGTPEFKERSLGNGKSAWAAGRLAKLTGEKQFYEAFAAIATNVLRRQSRNGVFLTGSAADHVAAEGVFEVRGDAVVREAERTAEFTMWVAEYLRLLSVGIEGSNYG